MRPVAIAGVGVVCGLGSDLPSLMRGLEQHRSAAAAVQGLGSKLPFSLAVEVRHAVPELEAFPDDRKVALLMAAVRDALEGCSDVPPERRGVMLGTGLSSVTPRELEEDVYPHVVHQRVDRASATSDLASNRVSPRRHLPARALGHVARGWCATGPCGTAFSACAAGAEAIAAGARAIARGDADVVLAGGHDSMVHPLGMLSFHVLGALSVAEGRPFDRHRDGFLLGEGAAVLRLEAAELCANPLGWVLGAGSSLDAFGITAPHPQGLGAEHSMQRALRDAGISPSAISWVNAHATGTPLGDRAEAAAIKRLLGPHVAVSSLKGALGHTLAAAGAVEAACTIAGWLGGFTPGTVGCVEPDPDLEIGVVLEPRRCTPGITLSNSFGFGGQNCSLVLAPPGFQ
jgi:3-oxoacyl-[acyl-carrier-protein] synthase II